MADLDHPDIDPRIVRLLEFLLEHHDLNVRMVRTGHPLGATTPNGRENDHWYFRAIDIDAVDGCAVIDRPIGEAVVRLGRRLVDLPDDLRPASALGPDVWHAALGGGAVTGFRDEPTVNARHHDHLHLGYRRPAC